MFTRIKKSPTPAASGENGLYFKKRLLRRMDAISYNHDAYGKVTDDYVSQHRGSDPKTWKSFSRNTSNETILKYSVTLLDNLESIVVRQPDRSERRCSTSSRSTAYPCCPTAARSRRSCCEVSMKEFIASEKARLQALFDEFNRDGSLDGDAGGRRRRRCQFGLVDSYTVTRVAPHFDAAGNVTKTDFWLMFKSVGYNNGYQYAHTIKVVDWSQDDTYLSISPMTGAAATTSS